MPSHAVVDKLKRVNRLHQSTSQPVNQSTSQPVNHSSFLKSPSYYLSNLSTALKHGHAVLQLGGYWSIQGESQDIAIDGLVGDRFTVTQGNASNGLVGLAWFIDGKDYSHFKMAYGINAFYLAPTAVTGDVIQEHLFTNLSYSYQLTHYPVYAIAKAIINTPSPKYAVTVDVGIGPNFMRAADFQESSLDGITIPDAIFSSHTNTTFSATAGLGMKFNHVFGQAPLECGYRFFYLGQGRFNATTNQTPNALSTGSDFGNALMCSITV